MIYSLPRFALKQCAKKLFSVRHPEGLLKETLYVLQCVSTGAVGSG